MTKQEMYNLIVQEDKRVQANKTKRNLKLFFGSAIIFYIVNFAWLKNNALDSLLLSLVYAALYFFSGILFWVPFIQANDRENKHLEEMKKEYQEKFD